MPQPHPVGPQHHLVDLGGIPTARGDLTQHLGGADARVESINRQCCAGCSLLRSTRRTDQGGSDQIAVPVALHHDRARVRTTPCRSGTDDPEAAASSRTT
ncbi:MAG: hypothetical protein IPG94_22185 [Kineosporiaceae bacterium]|nr:hypothetical protein [Kineosporiaceae bacterium]